MLIAQHMALDYPDTVRTLTLCSTFARFDAGELIEIEKAEEFFRIVSEFIGRERRQSWG